MCSHRVEPGQGVNVQVVRDPLGNLNVWFTHPGCGPSRLVDGTKTLAPDPDGEDMRMTALPPRTGHGLPILAAQLVRPVFTKPEEQGGELTEVLAPYLLSQGFSMLGELDSTPPHLEQWIAVLIAHPAPDAGTARLLILDPEASQFFSGVVCTPGGWCREALARGGAALYVGDAGLDPTSPHVHQQHERLARAARQGRLLAATISVIER
ncbi:hypothetical protein [Streptacidiphilus anmyonensis]|uniref:hypothetical protein n=1 Tax=Streptacidiphilus anmyonensis TaxID=405782 RepID=UPI00128D0C3B|nr:hypothetical protein [Streptacidiphilus anmyonensis]